jgi:hypothetical protein
MRPADCQIMVNAATESGKVQIADALVEKPISL